MVSVFNIKVFWKFLNSYNFDNGTSVLANVKFAAICFETWLIRFYRKQPYDRRLKVVVFSVKRYFIYVISLL